MAKMHYYPIGPGQIRLLKLLPGSYTDDIHIEISHVNFPRAETHDEFDVQELMKEAAKDLPKNWYTVPTLEGALIFCFQEGKTITTFWNHPVTGKRWPYPKKVESLGHEADPVPEYEALSYVWGEEQDQYESGIFVVDHPTNPFKSVSRIDVPPNLESALRHLRYGDRPRTLWVDAICINQTDYDERSGQVVRMAEIYSSAKRVRVWLGKSFGQSDRALDIFEHIGGQVIIANGGQLLPAPEATDKNLFAPDHPLPFDEAAVEVIKALLQRPWFSRLWVVQEVQLSIEAMVQCGHRTIPWMCFRRALCCMFVKSQLDNSLRKIIVLTMGMAIPPGRRPFLFDFLMNQTRNCKDPRDKVYGLLGLAPQDLVLKIIPRYNLPVESVYRAASEVMSTYYERLDLLRHCRFNDLPENWPASWIVDFTAFSIYTVDYYWQFSAGFSRAHIKFNGLTLTAKGVRCAIVHDVKRQVPLDDGDAIRTVRGWEPAHLDTAPYINGKTLREAYANLICREGTEERLPSNVYLPLSTWMSQEMANPFFGHPEKGSEWQEPSFAETSALEGLKCSSLFTTQEGYIGLSRGGPQMGDVVCVLLGCDCPMVLRPLADSSFQVVGPAHVYGLGDLSAILGPLPKPWRVRIAFEQTGGTPEYYFYNEETEVYHAEDPRLEPLDGWEVVERIRSRKDPLTFKSFRNTNTGELVKHDPRLEPEPLKARGVRLENFAIV